MTFEEARVIFIVYSSSLVPLYLIIFYRNLFPVWIPKFYLGAFVTCALGWEIWMTFGLIDGDPVNLRRSTALNIWIPQNINWALNSLGDAGAVCLGGLWLMWRYAGKNIEVFKRWDWGAFGKYSWTRCSASVQEKMRCFQDMELWIYLLTKFLMFLRF